MTLDQGKIKFKIANFNSTSNVRLSIDQGTNGSIAYFLESDNPFSVYIADIDRFCIIGEEEKTRLA